MPGPHLKRSRLDEDADEKIEKHDSIFEDAMRLFANNPTNHTFIDYYEETIYAIPSGNPRADVYTLRHTSQPTGLIKLNEVELSAKLQFERVNGTDIVAEQDVVFNIPCPLRTMWKTKEVKINHSLINIASNYEQYISYLKFLMTETPTQYKDKPEINMAILDTGGQFNHNGGASNGAGNIGTGYRTHTDAGHAATLNFGARQRHAIASVPGGVNLIDILDVPLFNDKGVIKFLLTTFDIEIRLTRANLNQIIMGSELPVADENAIEGVKLLVHNLELKLPTYKPNEQLRKAINNTLVDLNNECKYFMNEYRIVVDSINANATSHQATDIFNGSLPTRLYIMLVDQPNFDGSLTTNCFDIKWFNLNYIEVKQNSNIVDPKIYNSKQAYNLLQKNLNRKYREMPFSYKDYENGYAIIMYDLSSNHDGHIKTLPLATTGNLSVDLKFSANTRNLRVIYVGEYKNQLQLSYQQQARRIYDF